MTPLPALPRGTTAPAPAASTPSSGQPADPAAEGFAALVARLVAGPAPGVPAAPSPPAPVGETPTSPEEEPAPGDETGEPTTDTAATPYAVGVVGLPLPGLGLTVDPPAAGAVPPETPTVATGGVATQAAPLVLEGEVPSPAAGAATAPAATASADSAPAPTPATVDVRLPSATPAPTTAPAPTPATAPAPAAGATQQVLPEITRLVSRGDGTHRLTMTLQPEALGEVRVTLTVRNGEVHVRMAAGSEAQQALLEGAPELRRVLELSGATDTRVVVRDLASTTTGSSQPSSPGTAGHEGRGDSGAAREGHAGNDGHPAGTRSGTTARDGATGGASTPRPDPVVHARSSGVDVTM